MPEWQLLADTQLSLWTVAGRLIAACLLAGVIGFEREHRRHAAGFRTHMLVALAAAEQGARRCGATAGAPEAGGAATSTPRPCPSPPFCM